MYFPASSREAAIQRVRAILLTPDQKILFIKRIKPHKPTPYWVAPGGGVEEDDPSLYAALHRELQEELGARAEVLQYGFVLRHTKADKYLEEHFFICRLLHLDLDERSGPEFDDPTRGEYIPDVVPLNRSAIRQLNIRTVELRDYLLENIEALRRI